MKLQKRILLIFLILVFSLTIKSLGVSEGEIITYEGTTIIMPEVYEMNEETMLEDALYEDNSIVSLITKSVGSGSISISDIISKYEDEYTCIGIDVSYHQGDIDWSQVADSGVTFVMIRCGFRGYGDEGKIVQDSRFEEYMEGATEAGLDIGIYFYSTALTEEEALEEAVFVVDLIEDYDIDYPIAYDFEEYGTTGHRTENITVEQMNLNAEKFLSYVESKGYVACLYGSKNYMEKYWDSSLKSTYSVWLANYTTNTEESTYAEDYDMWQCTSSGSVPGINTAVDVNVDYYYCIGTHFSDITSTAWYYRAVRYLYKNGIMTGYGDTGTFGPNNTIRRGELVTILYRLSGEPTMTIESTYKDVTDSTKYYYEAIVWATINGIVSGYGDTGYFKPNQNITRQELAIMLYNYAEYRGLDVSETASLSGFADNSKVSSWATTQVKWAVSKGIISGISTSNGKVNINPTGNATRAQAATMIYRFLKILDKEFDNVIETEVVESS